jgi:hypothetical protein
MSAAYVVSRRRPRRVRCNACRCRVPRHYARRAGPRGGWVCEDCRVPAAGCERADPGTSAPGADANGRACGRAAFAAGVGRRPER